MTTYAAPSDDEGRLQQDETLLGLTGRGLIMIVNEPAARLADP